LRHGAAETRLLIRAARAGPAAGQQSLLHQARAVRLQRGTGAQGVRAAQQALGHRYQVALERADGLQVAVSQALSVVADQGVQRQGGGNRSDAARRQGRAGRQSLQRNPAHHAVATRPAPGAILTALQHVEGLAEQQLIDALTIVGDDVGDRQAAVSGIGPAIGLGPHQAFQRLLGQHHAIPVPQDQGRARRQQGQDIGQAAVSRRLGQFEPPTLGADPEGGVNSLGYLTNLSLR